MENKKIQPITGEFCEHDTLHKHHHKADYILAILPAIPRPQPVVATTPTLIPTRQVSENP